MADLSQPDNPNSLNEDDNLSHLLLNQLEDPWYRTLIKSVKELISPPKLPPLEVTSKPIPVKDIWGLYGRQKKSFMMSTGVQTLIVAVVCILGITKQGQMAVKHVATLFIDTAPPDMAPKKEIMKGGGGGGDRSPLPASFGKLPKAALKQFTPPVAVFNNMNPKLMMDPSIIAPPDMALPQVNSDHYGDPFSHSGILH